MSPAYRIIALWLVLVAPGSRALAEAPDTARADALFNQGKAKLAEQDFAAACPLLAESFGIDPATGTLLAMALCHERAGELATAISEYRNAATRSRQEGRADREHAADQRADELEAKLAQAAKPEPATPVQPVHGAREPVAETARRPAPAPTSGRGGLSTGQWIGIGTAGAGVIAFGVSAGFAAHASSLASDSEAGCDGDLCTAQARKTRLDARASGNIATLMVLSGAVLVTTGAAIFFASGSDHDEAGYALAPWIAPNAAGATAAGRF